MNELKIGISGPGVLHTDAEVPDIEAKFRMVAESGAFDYIDRTPLADGVESHLQASQRFGIPTLPGGFYYMVGRDEALLERNLMIGRECGSTVHSVQIFTKTPQERYFPTMTSRTFTRAHTNLAKGSGYSPASKTILTCGPSTPAGSNG
jgi:hypothetical protein